MSHFMTLVILDEDAMNPDGSPNEFDRRGGNEYVTELLAPYSENIRHAPKPVPCHCVGAVARREVQDQEALKFGSLDAERTRFHQREDVQRISKTLKDLHDSWPSRGAPHAVRKHYRKENDSLEKARQDLWEKVCRMEERQAFKEEKLASHPERDKPSPECGFYTGEPQSWWDPGVKAGDRYKDKSGCGGTGKAVSTSNPDAHWDWYEVGGRWTAHFTPGYDPYSDPENQEPCAQCRGTGMRNDTLGKKARKENPAYTCNGCQGKGSSTKFQLKPHDQDVLPVEHALKLLEEDEVALPFAIVTPDGIWHEEASMGWFGCHSEGDKDWPQKVLALLRENRSKICVVVDCHI